MKTTLWACAAMLPVLLFAGFISDGLARISLRVVRPDIPLPEGVDWSLYLVLLAVWAVVSGVMIWATKQGYIGR